MNRALHINFYKGVPFVLFLGVRQLGYVLQSIEYIILQVYLHISIFCLDWMIKYCE